MIEKEQGESAERDEPITRMPWALQREVVDAVIKVVETVPSPHIDTVVDAIVKNQDTSGAPSSIKDMLLSYVNRRHGLKSKDFSETGVRKLLEDMWLQQAWLARHDNSPKMKWLMHLYEDDRAAI